MSSFLPPELQDMVLDLCPLRAWAALSRVSRDWRAAALARLRPAFLLSSERWLVAARPYASIFAKPDTVEVSWNKVVVNGGLRVVYRDGRTERHSSKRGEERMELVLSGDYLYFLSSERDGGATAEENVNAGMCAVRLEGGRGARIPLYGVAVSEAAGADPNSWAVIDVNGPLALFLPPWGDANIVRDVATGAHTRIGRDNIFTPTGHAWLDMRAFSCYGGQDANEDHADDGDFPVDLGDYAVALLHACPAFRAVRGKGGSCYVTACTGPRFVTQRVELASGVLVAFYDSPRNPRGSYVIAVDGKQLFFLTPLGEVRHSFRLPRRAAHIFVQGGLLYLNVSSSGDPERYDVYRMRLPAEL